MNKLNILLLKESDTWVAQCLEYDIAAQGNTIREAMTEFQYIFVAEIAFSIEKGKAILAGIPAAPQYYWKLFEEEDGFW